MNRILIATIVSILSIPIASIIPIPGGTVWYGQFIAMAFCLFLGISVYLWKFNKYISIFTIICLISAFFQTKINPRAIILLYQLYMAALAAYGISKFNAKQRKWLIYTVLALVIINAGWLVVQKFNLDPIFKSIYDPKKNELVGFCGAKDQLGSFFALSAPVMAYIFPPLLIISVIGILISKASFALAAIIGGTLFYYWFINKRFFYSIFVVVAILATIFFCKFEQLQVADFKTRFSVWKYAIKSTIKGQMPIIRCDLKQNANLWYEYQYLENKLIIEERLPSDMAQRLEFLKSVFKPQTIKTNPLWGWGMGSFAILFPQVPENADFNYINEKFNHAHNDYIETFFELGYLGIIALLAFIFNIVFKVFKMLKTNKTKELILFSSVLVAFAINAIGNFVSQLAVTWMFGILFYGLLEGALRDGQTSSVG